MFFEMTRGLFFEMTRGLFFEMTRGLLVAAGDEYLFEFAFDGDEVDFASVGQMSECVGEVEHR